MQIDVAVARQQCIPSILSTLFFFFNDTATTEIYTLSLHDALPISSHDVTVIERNPLDATFGFGVVFSDATQDNLRSEEHTSELQSQSNLVCRLLLEKKKDKTKRFLGAPPASTPAAMQAGSPTQRLT